MEGYKPHQSNFMIKKGRASSIYIDLSSPKPLKGRVFVESEPVDARVRILNIIPRFYQGIELDPGRYNIEVSAPGYDKEDVWIDLGTGEEKRITIRLEPEKVIASTAAIVAEIAEREKEIIALDAQIKGMKKRLGTAVARSDDSLEAMFAMVKKKEEQQKRIEEMKRARDLEEAKIHAAIERVKREKKEKVMAEVKGDINKYEEIISSPFGKDMKASAWNALAAKYTEETDGLEPGDTDGLFLRVAGLNSIGMEFVEIPAGSFMMGSPSDEKGSDKDEKQHRVNLTRAFYMQTTEVTQAQWKKVMGSNPSHFNKCGDNCPVDSVSWNDCQDFIRRLNQKERTDKYRLPTEAEWEYAARAGSTARYCFGDDKNRLGQYAWYNESAGGKTHTVASKNPNAWGLYDMHGNVWEWCEDWYGNYPSYSITNPRGPLSGSCRVSRGGCLADQPENCHTADRDLKNPNFKNNSLGFRLAMNIDMGPVLPTNGWLYVDTEPDDAAIRILNPSHDFCQGMELEEGKYNIEASASGYEKKEMWVDLAAAEVKRIALRLEKVVIPCTINISGKPKGAEILLNDRFVGKLPLILDGIRPGSHRVEVSAPWYKTVKQTVSLSEGEKRDLKILLEKTGPKEVGRDGVYISYDNGIVVDTSRRLEWIAGQDSDTYWGEAVAWVHSQNTDGRGWRMPTLEELKGLYRKGYGTRNMTPLLNTTGWVIWSGENEESACALNFYDATITGKGWFERNVAMFGRVFAVRSITEDRVSRMNRGLEFSKPASSTSNEIARDGVYVAYVNGIVRDTSTGLEWIFGPDKNTKWEDAKLWVKALEIDGGGWRMPTLYEMQSIYKDGSGVRNMTPLLKTTGWYGWSGKSADSSNVWVFDFGSGTRISFYSEASFYARAMAVRSIIKDKVASIQPSTISTEKEKQDRGVYTDKKSSPETNSEQITKKATVEIKGKPEGAKVYIDNRHAGAMPLKEFEVSPGSHRVSVSQEGYYDYQKTINVEDGRSVSICIELNPVRPAKARLYMDTDPGDAAVSILNITAKFSQGIELEAGKYNIEVSAKGYEKKEMWIDLAAGEDKRISIRLEPEKVVLPPSSDSTFTNSIGMKFVLIPAGSFEMGSPSNEKGRDNKETQHRVILTKNFFMGETEVTQGQWKSVMDKNPSHFSDCGEDCPVERVSWDECQEFIKKLNEMEGTGKYRLPTEAEWEYACRAGSTGAYAGDLNEMGWYENNSGSHTHNVKEKKPNAWGLYDMHGNVWEWCEDWDGYYLSGPVTDPSRTSFGFLRIFRGGSWNVDSGLCRAASRRAYLPGIWAFDLGFRIVFHVE
jgi:formylglycine-generating enzyme required for sulfatase activity